MGTRFNQCFLNSDNCDGDNFYYPTAEKMQEAIKFRLYSYENRWFVRFTVIDKKTSKAIGTIELFNRGETDDDFSNVGVLRLDIRSDHEKESVLFDIISLIIPSAYSLFDCTEIITKAPSYAIERISAIEKFGFKKSDGLLVGKYGTHDKYPYNEYWTVKK